MLVLKRHSTTATLHDMVPRLGSGHIHFPSSPTPVESSVTCPRAEDQSSSGFPPVADYPVVVSSGGTDGGATPPPPTLDPVGSLQQKPDHGAARRRGGWSSGRADLL